MELKILAVVNAIVWSGIIEFLLLRTMSQRQEIDGQLERIERKLDDLENKAH